MVRRKCVPVFRVTILYQTGKFCDVQARRSVLEDV